MGASYRESSVGRFESHAGIVRTTTKIKNRRAGEKQIVNFMERDCEISLNNLRGMMANISLRIISFCLNHNYKYALQEN